MTKAPVPEGENEPRCDMAIHFGGPLHTRCGKPVSHVSMPLQNDKWHQGRGLPDYPAQKITWFPGDRREFSTDREDEFAWEADPKAEAAGL